MSEFDGLQKHEKTLHALVGLGSAAVAAATSLTQVRRLEMHKKRDHDVYKIISKNIGEATGAGNSNWRVLIQPNMTFLIFKRYKLDQNEMRWHLMYFL